jgi:chromosome segregation ATPase
MTHSKSYATAKAICLQLASKSSELGDRRRKLSHTERSLYELLDAARDERGKAAIRTRMAEVRRQDQELTRQIEVIDRELEAALDEAERLQRGGTGTPTKGG